MGLVQSIQRILQPGGEKRPEKGRLVPADVNDRYSEYPSVGLTPVKLARIFREADAGDVRAQMELFEEIEEKDAHIASQMQTRKMAVLGLDWEIHEASDEDRDKEIAAFVEEQITTILNQEEDVLLNILDAIGKGISVMELEWDVDRLGRNIIKAIHYIPPKKLVWDGLEEEMKICTREYPSGMRLTDNKFVVHRYQARSGHPTKAGVLRSVVWMYLFKNYDLKDWVTFCEVYGMPIRLGKYAESASEDDKIALKRALISIGTDAAGILSAGSEIEIIEANKTASAEIYERLARYCDEQNSKAIVGQTLTADSGGGSYAQGKVHGEVRHDLVKADAAALAKTINRDIIAPLVRFNFGEAPLPSLEFDTKEDEDLKTAAEVYQIVISNIGLPVSEDHLYEKFNIPRPGDGEKLLSPKTSTQVMPQMAYKSLKSAGTEQSEAKDAQRILDGMTAEAMELSGELFDHMLQPLKAITEEASSLEELRSMMRDQKCLKELLNKMDQGAFQETLEKGLYLSELIGRSMEA